MTRKTALFNAHVAMGGKMVDFAGWQMPLNYGSQVQEHQSVRTDAGMFDVSHMTVVDVSGEGARPFLRRLVANDVGRLQATGQALYGALLNEAGGVIDDLIVYRQQEGYRCVVNAATRDKVLAWFTANNADNAIIVEQDLAMIAVQGPTAIERVRPLVGNVALDALAAFSSVETDGMMIARTGYTGEDGVEIILSSEDATTLWQALAGAGVKPAGLAARDTLRLEAGLNLYGQDMDETTSVLTANMAWTVAWEGRDFIGKVALEKEREAGVTTKLTGLVMTERGVLRRDQPVKTSAGDGVITSGIFSPTLGYSIALARLPKAAKGQAEVEIRGKLHPVSVVRPPFVRQGKQVYKHT